MGEIVTSLVRRKERKQFWRDDQADYQRLRSNPQAWDEYQAELAVWDLLTGDGLGYEPPYFTVEEEREIRAQAAVRPETP